MVNRPYYFTPGERSVVQQSIERMKSLELPEAERNLRRLLEADDELDEDEYDNVREHQLNILSNIEQLESILSNTPTRSAKEAAQADHVRPGSSVTVRSRDGRLLRYEMNSPYGSIPGRGEPNGGGAAIRNALMGAQVGERVSVTTPQETFDLEIVDVQQHPLIAREAE
jgi:transcription elongation GreA/GreB family factor